MATNQTEVVLQNQSPTQDNKDKGKQAGKTESLFKENRQTFELMVSIFIVVGMPVYLGVPLEKDYNTFKCMFILSIPLCIFIGAAMAANDVANSMGSTYGARILSMNKCLLLAVVFEVIGILTMGGAVAKTITKGIIDPQAYIDQPEYYVMAMPAVLAGASLTTITCTIYGLPVSITKGTIFGLLAVGLVSIGKVDTMGIWKCIIGLIVSPILGAVVSCILHLILIVTIKKKQDPIKSAKIVQPIVGGFAMFVLITFILYKGIKIEPFWLDILIGLAVGLVTWAVLFIILKKKYSDHIEVQQNAVSSQPNQQNGTEISPQLIAAQKLFDPLVVIAACFMAFAHGSNDVGNAVGPMAGVYEVMTNNNEIPTKVDIPFWTLGVGAATFAVGILTAGSRTSVTLGDKITDFDGIKAFAANIGAAFAILVASVLKIPVSTSHVTFGAIIGGGIAEKCMKIPVKLASGKIYRIVFVWIILIPCSMFSAIFLFYEFKGIFTDYNGFQSD